MEPLEGLRGETIVITGAGGMLGRAFQEALAEVPTGARVLALPRADLDVTDRNAVLGLAAAKPTLIVHCAADVNADRCEDDEAGCRAVQVGGTANVADLALAVGARVVYPQSFLIFGEVDGPIHEDVTPAPLSVYGRCKLEAEQLLLDGLPATSLVVRMAGFFGGDAVDKNFVGKFVPHVLARVTAGDTGMDVGDRVWQPTYTLDLARNTLLLAVQRRTGVYHMASHGEASFHDLAAACVEELGLARSFAVRRVDATSMAGREKARRPRRAVMENRRLIAEGLDRQRSWRDALREYLARPHFQNLVAGATSRMES